MKNSTKTYFFAILCLLLTTVVSAQQSEAIHEDDVPLGIQGYFYSSYKNASEASWSIKDYLCEKSYQVSFLMSEVEKAVVYDFSGNLIEEISFQKKPRSEFLMRSKVENKYPDAKVLSVKKVTRFNIQGLKEPKSYFEVSAKNGKNIVYVFFDEDKQLMKTNNVFNLAVN